MVDGVRGEIVLAARSGQSLERRTIPPLAAPLVPNHVGGDPVKPRQLRLFCELELASAPPRFEEDDRSQILGQLVIGRSAEAVAVDPLRVLVPESHMTDRIGLGSDRPTP